MILRSLASADRAAEVIGGCLAIGGRWPRLRRPRRVVPVVLVVALTFAEPRLASARPYGYLPIEMWRAWQRLVPEAAEIRLCGLTRAGHELWAQGQLRVPLSPGAVAVGALAPDQELWAVLPEVGDEPVPCDRVLVLARSGWTWQRLAWQRLDLDPGVVPTGVLWDATRAAVLIDTGERRRLTAPATLRWEDGRVLHATPGFVIEVRLIRHVLWWRADGPRFEYERLTVPLEVPARSEEQP